MKPSLIPRFTYERSLDAIAIPLVSSGMGIAEAYALAVEEVEQRETKKSKCS